MSLKPNRFWKECPICGNPKMLMLRDDTEMKNFPAWCKKCKKENLVTIEPKRQIVNV